MMLPKKRFDEATAFDHALIGRPGPSMGKDPPSYTPSASLSRGMSTQPEGCQKVPYYSLEQGALMVVIRDGQLSLLVKSRQKKEMLFKTPFNDGNWHRVVISHDDRKLTLAVDAQTPRTIKVPRKIGLASMMYIGGLPFISERNFELGAVLELQLEFRTSELSGVLLSITAPGGSPSLSLELNNGKVIMSGDLGDNNPLYVEQHFASPYAICDNRWHRIQAVYNDEELALKVDDLDQKYGLPANVNYHFMGSTASSPLYIGGLPESAPKGTLITRDHFNGCIRNVMMGGERRDWTDMAELHNIHLSSCPIQ